jgi:galactose mutarotase-like enzyme
MDRDVTLRGGDAVLHLDVDTGGRVTHFSVGGIEILAHLDPTSPFHWGSFVMAPWAGRIRNGRFTFDGREHQLPLSSEPHAIHGTVVDRPWWVADATGDSVVLDCQLDERWPWRGFVRQVIRLGERVADFRIEVHADDEAFPAAAGWHPWFRRHLRPGADPVEMDFAAEAMLIRDATGIPTGERGPITEQPWDDCFDGVRWPVTLTWPGTMSLAISSDTRYGVVYTERSDALCVEPQTGPPDALNLEPFLVRPGQPLATTMTWSWRVP